MSVPPLRYNDVVSEPWYEPSEPPVALREVLACSWTARPTGRHRLTPDGCTDLVVLSSGVAVLCGPELTAWSFELPAATTSVGVRFRPGAAHAVFGVDVGAIVDQRVPFAAIVDPATAAAIVDSVAAAGYDDRGRTTLVRAIARLAGPDPRNDEFAERVITLLVAGPGRRVADLAAETGLTVRQFQRRCNRVFGYGSSSLALLIRLQRLAATALAEPGQTIGRLAAAAGYSDHAHLARDCRAIAGLTPSAFLAAYFPTFPDMSDPYKTRPEHAGSMDADE